MKSLLLFLVLLCAWPCAANAQEEPLLQVYSRDGGEYLDASPLPLHGEEWRWLQERERLIMGVPRPDNPPMDITLRANAYEGVTADIVGMLTHLAAHRHHGERVSLPSGGHRGTQARGDRLAERLKFL